MQHRVPTRLPLFAIAAAILAACSGGGQDGLAAISGPSQSGVGSDTATSNPATPTPVARFNLHVTVAAPQPGADSLTANDPVANASVTVLKQELKKATVPTTGSDTLFIEETEVATGTTDANGVVVFSDLPAASYRVVADAPDVSGSTALPGAYVVSSDVSLLVLVR